MRKWLLVLLATACLTARADDSDRSAVFFQRAEKSYQEARTRYRNDPKNTEAAWHFARACSDRADVARKKKEKSDLAKEGILACRQALIDDPNSAWAHYYLGIGLGQLADTRGLGALSELREMEEEWNAAIRIDPTIDYGGPYRCLGLLYTQAPGWPLSIGSRTLAIKYLGEAVRVSPDFPDNLLSLIDAHLRWNELTQARGIAAGVPEDFGKERKILSGPEWESSWVDWDNRWEAIQSRLKEVNRAPSPHTTTR